MVDVVVVVVVDVVVLDVVARIDGIGKVGVRQGWMENVGMLMLPFECMAYRSDEVGRLC